MEPSKMIHLPQVRTKRHKTEIKIHLGTDYKSKESKDRSKSRPKSQSRSERSRKEKTEKNDTKGMPKIAQPPLGSDFIKVTVSVS